MLVKSPIETLKHAFLKRCILEIADVYKIMQTNSRTTAYRCLQKVGALSSYSHARKYYTLKEIPQFDEHGLWHYGDISFSKYGTLIDTIVNLVSNCDRGKSCSELEKQQRVYVQNALLSLVNSKKLIRQKMNGIYIYYSPDPIKSSSQIHKRSSQKATAPLPNWVILQVLVATLKCASGYVTAEDVISQLKKQGSDITLDQVQKVCKKTYAPQQPSQLAPQYCNFGFDIVVHVGKAVFQSHRTEHEVAYDLRQQNVLISQREVSYLAKKFICYLAVAHREKVHEIRELIENNGGSCLHFDGTNDGGGPHLIVAIDEQEKLVLGSVKVRSESTECVSLD